jgi:hypothetical protein
MDSKSKSKKFLIEKIKYPLDPLIKRHKSQESYSDMKAIKTEISVKLFKTKKSYNNNNFENKNFNNKIKTKKIHKSPEIKSSNLLLKGDQDIKIIDTEENVNPFINIINQQNENFDVDEFIEECDICDDLEELRGSIFNKDFYTNSIGETSDSFIGKDGLLINNLPKPFVKQAEKNIGIATINSGNSCSNTGIYNKNNNINSNSKQIFLNINIFFR